AMTAGMMRGKFTITPNGIDNGGYYVGLGSTLPTGGELIDMRLPANNYGRCNSILADLYTDTTTNGAISMVSNLRAQILHDSGYLTRHGWLSNSTWLRFLKNQEVQQFAGTSVSPFDQWDGKPKSDRRDGKDGGSFTATLRGLPDFTFHITDETIDIG